MTAEQRKLKELVDKGAFTSERDITFATSLADAPRPSDSQRNWIDIMIKRGSGTSSEPVAGNMDLSKVTDILNKAAANLQAPAFRVCLANEFQITIKRSSPKSRYPGTTWISASDGSITYGYIKTNGEVVKRDDNPEVWATVERFAADPFGEARRFARLIGRCCFCAAPLSTEESTEAGYGPICAGHYGLPWGKELKKILATIEDHQPDWRPTESIPEDHYSFS